MKKHNSLWFLIGSSTLLRRLSCYWSSAIKYLLFISKDRFLMNNISYFLLDKIMKEIFKIIFVMYKNNFQSWAIFQRGPFSVNPCQLCYILISIMRKPPPAITETAINILCAWSEKRCFFSNFPLMRARWRGINKVWKDYKSLRSYNRGGPQRDIPHLPLGFEFVARFQKVVQ